MFAETQRRAVSGSPVGRSAATLKVPPRGQGGAVSESSFPGNALEPEDLETTQREPWWFLLWMLWGGICAGIVHYADQTATGPILWLVAGAVAGYFGQPWMAAVTVGVCRVQEALFGVTDKPPPRKEGESAVAYAARCALAARDPNHKPWAALLPTLLVAAPVHGVLIGSVVGAIVPAVSPVPGTALEVALTGLVAGPVVCCVLYGVVMLLVIWRTRGPAVGEAEHFVAAAAREAEAQGLGYVGPGHLLVAVLENLEGPAGDVLKARPIDLDQARATVRAAAPRPAEPRPAAGPGGEHSGANAAREQAPGFDDAIDEAIRLARKFRDGAVRSGHLLLGLLADPAPAVRRALETAEIDPNKLRDELYDEMRPD